jgi:hypothetical protein
MLEGYHIHSLRCGNLISRWYEYVSVLALAEDLLNLSV